MGPRGEGWVVGPGHRRDHLLDTQSAWNKIVVCNDCYNSLISKNDYLWKGSNCSKCVYWSQPVSRNEQITKYDDVSTFGAWLKSKIWSNKKGFLLPVKVFLVRKWPKYSLFIFIGYLALAGFLTYSLFSTRWGTKFRLLSKTMMMISSCLYGGGVIALKRRSFFFEKQEGIF